jgi:hypothetical protein
MLTNNFKSVHVDTRIYNNNAVVVEFIYRDVIYSNGVELSEVVKVNMIPQVFVFKRLVEPFLHVSGIKYTLDQLHDFNTDVCNKITELIAERG